jgi:hypothetical protein
LYCAAKKSYRKIEEVKKVKKGGGKKARGTKFSRKKG